MNKRILLVEPDYSTKVPPLGLMKLSTFHKQRGDKVTFVRGCSDIRMKKWHRVYISSIFTWNFDTVVETAKWYKKSVEKGKLFVGGHVATLLTEELQAVIPFASVIKGLLNEQGKIGLSGDAMIDDLSLDYTIVQGHTCYDSIINNMYVNSFTRGCIRKCKFCGVRVFEPKYVPYRNVRVEFKETERALGKTFTQLSLSDNNVLASPELDKIVSDICKMGFKKDAVRDGKQVSVDFNQAMDIRLLTDDIMKQLDRVAINPYRFSFDDYGMEKVIKSKFKLLQKYDVEEVSFFILYNFKDTPEEFYKRTTLLYELSQKHDIITGFFPMRYVPLEAKTRGFIGEHWNSKFLRAVDTFMINVPNRMRLSKFYEQRFGSTLEEFIERLYLPEEFIVNWGECQGVIPADRLTDDKRMIAYLIMKGVLIDKGSKFRKVAFGKNFPYLLSKEIPNESHAKPFLIAYTKCLIFKKRYTDWKRLFNELSDKEKKWLVEGLCTGTYEGLAYQVSGSKNLEKISKYYANELISAKEKEK